MNIVLEGPDGGGKSTLADELSDYLGYVVQRGSGPPKAPNEINLRIENYLTFDERIFDRHPAVSQVIYDSIRGGGNLPDATLLRRFYTQDNLFIYCRSTNADRHVVKPGEDPKHIEVLTAKYRELVGLYDAWALKHAHVIYRIGDNIRRLAKTIEEYVQ